MLRWFLASGFSSYTELPLLLCSLLLLLLLSRLLTRSSKAAKPVECIRWPVILADGSMVCCLHQLLWQWDWYLLTTLHMWNRTPQAQGQSPIGQDSRHMAGSNNLPVGKLPIVIWAKTTKKRCSFKTHQGCKKKQRRSGNGCGFPLWRITLDEAWMRTRLAQKSVWKNRKSPLQHGCFCHQSCTKSQL